MLGNTLVTKQTGEAGKQVNRLYIEDGADIDRELYLLDPGDRTVGQVSFVVSTEGGMDIEAVAEETPEKIITVCRSTRGRRDDATIAKLNGALELPARPPRTARSCSRSSTRRSPKRT
jgi:succinyl-CoA synthetase beta subunit